MLEKNQDVKYFPAYKVNVESTLGAGNSFKADAVYTLSKNYNDDDIVKTAAAIAAAASMHFPIANTPPTLALVKQIMAERPSL